MNYIVFLKGGETLLVENVCDIQRDNETIEFSSKKDVLLTLMTDNVESFRTTEGNDVYRVSNTLLNNNERKLSEIYLCSLELLARLNERNVFFDSEGNDIRKNKAFVELMEVIRKWISTKLV